jgi:hypothetical protein
LVDWLSFSETPGFQKRSHRHVAQGSRLLVEGPSATASRAAAIGNLVGNNEQRVWQRSGATAVVIVKVAAMTQFRSLRSSDGGKSLVRRVKDAGQKTLRLFDKGAVGQLTRFGVSTMAGLFKE